MPEQIETREIEVPHAGTFATEFADRLQTIMADQETWAVQEVVASKDGAQATRELIDWAEVLSAAKEALICAVEDSEDDETEAVPDDPQEYEIRSVNLAVDELGTVEIGVMPRA